MGLLDNVYAAATSTSNTATTAAGTAPHPNQMLNTVMMVAIFGLFIYLLLWRPQSRRLKDHRNLLASLGEGDEVITSGGVLGKINKVEDNIVELKISEGILIKVQKTAIVGSLPKGTLK